MKSLVGILVLIAILLSVIGGFLFYQLNVMNSANTELISRNAEVQTQLEPLLSKNDELEDRVTELQNQSDELEIRLEKYLNWVEITDFKAVSHYINIPMPQPVSFNVTVKNFGINDVENLTLIVESQFGNVTNSLDVLHVGEKRVITVVLLTSGKVILKLDDEVIDTYP